MDILPTLEDEYPEESRLAKFLCAAMHAGLRGEKLPDFGNQIKARHLLCINAVYDEARNKHAAAQARLKRI